MKKIARKLNDLYIRNLSNKKYVNNHGFIDSMISRK